MFCELHSLCTSSWPASIIRTHCSFFMHLVSSERVEVTGEAVGVMAILAHFTKESSLSMFQGEACTGFKSAPATNRIGVFNRFCMKRVGRELVNFTEI